MSKQHTPTPYILKGLSENGKNHFNIIGSKLGAKYRICQVRFIDSEFDKNEAEANSKFIVKAVNNHDRLVEALEHCIEIMEEMTAPDHLIETYGNAVMNYGDFLTELKA